MIRHIARVAAIALIGVGALVACGDDQEACAAPVPAAPVAAPVAEPMKPASQTTYKPPKYNPPKSNNNNPSGGRTTSKIQDKPRTSTTTKRTTTINPYWKSSSKPTTWGGYNTGKRNWSQPYHKGYPAAPQPVIVHVHNHDYRTYPGFYGYYPVGVWPVGYGQRYGCVADNESTPEAPNTPAPTVTITTTPPPTVTVTVPPTTTPSETPR